MSTIGFHIVNIENGILKKDYVESFKELAYINFITKDSIIYQGEEQWKPVKISESEKYKHFSEGWFRAGIQAQELFKEQATENGFILEELNQDQNSFKSYTLNSEKKPIKRGDFLIRNYANIEVDVKCRGFWKDNGESYFSFKCEDAEKHKNMMGFTNTPIIIAVYQNVNNKPVDNNIYFFAIDTLLSSDLNTHFRKKVGECYKIPVSFTQKGFDFIDKIYRKYLGVKEENYFVEEKRIKHPNAYRKWSSLDDEKLKALFYDGKSVKELSHFFGRNNGAIRSRVEKLGLKENSEETDHNEEK